MIMERVNFNPEWYGVQAKVLSRSERQMVVDYGCNGRGIVKIIACLREYNFASSILKRMNL